MLLAVIFLASNFVVDADVSHREEWVVRIPGGSQVASLLAAESGYRHHGSVNLAQFFVFLICESLTTSPNHEKLICFLFNFFYCTFHIRTYIHTINVLIVTYNAMNKSKKKKSLILDLDFKGDII